MRTALQNFLLATLIPSLFLAACDDGSTAPDETLARFDLDLPAAVTEGDSFDLAVTAVGSEGTRPFTGFTGQVTLVAAGGSGSAATIEPGSLTVTEGVGATEAVILGTSGEVSVEAGGGGATGSGEIGVAVDTTRRLAGDPSSPASAAIPDRMFEARPDDYSADHAELGGIKVSFNTLVLAFELGTTVAEANEVLTGMDAELVGGTPGAAGIVPGILVVRVPTSSHEELAVLVEALRVDERVVHVAPDMLLGTSVLPAENEDAFLTPWRWSLTPGGGNWGLELIRAPLLWNLNDNVGGTTLTGVLDVGFSASHEDLDYLEYQYPRGLHDHGTHVAGTVGATFDNEIGVDGLSPFADLVVRALPQWSGVTVGEAAQSFAEMFLVGLAQLVYAQPGVRVVNMSLGMNWGPAGVNQNESTFAQELIEGHGELFRIWLDALAAAGYDLPLIVVSAGNDSDDGFGDMAARWSSPMTYAGLSLDPPESADVSPIIVVESIDNEWSATGGATRSPFSNVGGHISAPGSWVTSTIEGGYGAMSGTSMAAPHVTGLISYLYALAPNLTHAQIRELLEHNAVPVEGGASDRIDAYATALDIDRVRGNTDVRRRLLDVDGNGTFDANDIADYTHRFNVSIPPEVEDCITPPEHPWDCPVYPRHDLNGDGLAYASRYDYDVGGPAPFDLDMDGSRGGTVTFDMVDRELTYEEFELTDLQILCYNAYSSAYQGNATARDAELYELCADTGVVPTVACRDLAPESSSGVPLDRIDLGAVPEEFEPPLLVKVQAEGSPASYTFVQLDDDGDPELVAPIHPSLSPQGGSVELTLTDGTLACEPFAFEVDPLPPAPGELAAIAGDIQDILGAQAAVLGTTPAEIVATPVDDLSPAHYPLALVQSVLDHPENPNSLVAFANGTSPDVEAARLDLIEPLVARTGLRGGVAGVSARISRSSSGPGGGATPVLADIDSDLCTPRSVGNDAGKLNACMNMAWSEVFRTEGASGRVLEDIGAAFGAAGLIPGADIPAAVTATVAWLVSNQRKKNAALLPSLLTSFDFDLDPSEFLEDEEGPGSWENARLTAQNLTWDSGKEVLEGLLNIAGLIGAFDKFQISKTELSALENYILSGPVAEKLLENGTPFTSNPQTFGPVDATADQWSESRIAAGDAVALVNHQEYEPRDVGTATLSVRTEDGEFGGQQLSEQKAVAVEQLKLWISPDDVSVPAGETEDLTVTVEDSDHPEMVEIDPSVPLQGTAEIVYNGDDTHTVTYTAPADPNPDEPDLLTVRHTAETGARGYSNEERTATATIRFAELEMSPPWACVDPDSTQEFTANVEGRDDIVVDWEVSPGTFEALSDTRMRYTAPTALPDDGTAMIEAWLVDEPATRDTVEINLGGCSCFLRVTVNGVAAEAGEFASPKFDLTADGSAVTGGFSNLEGFGNVSWGLGPAPGESQPMAIGQTGTRVALAQGVQPNGVGTYTTFLDADADSTGFQLAAVITENTGEVLAGTVSGPVWVWQAESGGYFSLRFRIVADPAASTETEKACFIE